MLRKKTSTGRIVCPGSFLTDILMRFKVVDDKIFCEYCQRQLKLRRHPIHVGQFQIPRHCQP